MKFWDKYSDWESAEKAWDEGAQGLQPLKKLKTLPKLQPIAETHLKWKSFKYLVFNRRAFKILKYCLKHPFRYGWAFLQSVIKKNSISREGDFFFYSLDSLDTFLKQAKKPNSLTVVGFSFCQKPIECPSGRFTDKCQAEVSNPVCRQCDIGKVCHALPDRCTPIFIPTVHYIGEKIFEIMEAHPKKELLFLITACEMSLEMFGDFGNMVRIKGVGVILKGRFCNTMRAFELAEEGNKTGLTLVMPETQKVILSLIRELRR